VNTILPALVAKYFHPKLNIENRSLFAVLSARVGLHPGTADSELSRPFQGNVPVGKLFTPEFSGNGSILKQ